MRWMDFHALGYESADLHNDGVRRIEEAEGVENVDVGASKKALACAREEAAGEKREMRRSSMAKRRRAKAECSATRRIGGSDSQPRTRPLRLATVQAIAGGTRRSRRAPTLGQGRAPVPLWPMRKRWRGTCSLE